MMPRRLLDSLLFAGAALAGPLSRWPVRPSREEGRSRLPGDEVVPGVVEQWTNAITIRGRPGEIWPWLAQMGCTRAGWYSYDGLDNGGVASAERIVPALQRVEVGDVLPWAPGDASGFLVSAVEPERALVLGPTPPPYPASWALVLEPVDRNSTRLIARVRSVPRRAAAGRLLWGVLHVVHFAMQRRQLLNIRRRVEAHAR
jgi:hypothetical protein